MELKEKVAYIKGMMEGMEFDTATKEGKLLAAVVDVLEEMAKEVTNHRRGCGIRCTMRSTP